MFGLSMMIGITIYADEQKTAIESITTETNTLLVSQKQTNNLTDFDSILVIHFHPTAQCSCCIKVGLFSQKGLKEYYSEPHQKGKFLFQEINVDEDTLIAKEYQVFWSALGFEKLYNGKKEFKEIESVWDFCENEVNFLRVFKKELDNFLAEPGIDTTRIEQSDENGK